MMLFEEFLTKLRDDLLDVLAYGLLGVLDVGLLQKRALCCILP